MQWNTICRWVTCLGALAMASLPGPGAGAEIGRDRLQPAERATEPQVEPASDEARQVMDRFELRSGFEVGLVAAEPMLANPVAFAIDEQGRFYTSETYRYRSSVLDIRHYRPWLEDDLALRTVEEREAMVRDYLGEEAEELAKETEVVRLIEDLDGDGRADESTVFAAGFDSILDGIASGVLARDGKVYFTNIPALWCLSDTTGDGRADRRSVLSRGYGVRFSFTGHDLHGLVVGPDGKLYFSVGDRGAHVETESGRVINVPDQGAVFRCNLDGSDLELYAWGLRNPQELAFDRYGNLFTGDNDSDQGDSERWVYVMEGSDSGWRVGYQWHPRGNAGPWNAEQLWVPHFEEQAAYILPPIANIDDGPSGLVYNYGGTGLPERYDDHFFLCHFKGSSANSGIRAYELESSGAGFELVKEEQFAWRILPTDVDFGPDGHLYFADWHEGWEKPGKGRIYRVSYEESGNDPVVAETEDLLAEGLKDRSTDELRRLLGHPDMRIRQRAQFALADRGPSSVDLFAEVARSEETGRLARLHAIWGLGQIAEKGQGGRDVGEPLRELLGDADPEVRAQAAKVIGKTDAESAAEDLTSLLEDSSRRVRGFAAMSLGKLGHQDAAPRILEMLGENGDEDPYLRHAGVMGLTWMEPTAALRKAGQSPSRSVRMGALLAMRRLERAEIKRFLHDSDPYLAAEAARAINDVPIDDAMSELAALIADAEHFSSMAGSEELWQNVGRPTLLRVINANFRIGGERQAYALASLAASNDHPEPIRVEAIRGLRKWGDPHPRDRIVGVYRPLAERDETPAREALVGEVKSLLKSGPEAVQLETVKAVEELGIRQATSSLFLTVTDSDRSGELRSRALNALASLESEQLDRAVELASEAEDGTLRQAAFRLMAQTHPEGSIEHLKGTLKVGSVQEKRAALETLTELERPEAAELIGGLMDQLLAGELSKELQLDVLQAAEASSDDEVQAKLQRYREQKTKEVGDDLLARYRETLFGGEPSRGREVFFERVDVGCARCHQIDGRGGESGPPLDGIGAERSRNELLESILYPNRAITPGFETVLVTLKDGVTYAGTLDREDEETLVLVAPFEGEIRIDKDEIESRELGGSGMMQGLHQLLTREELRDLIEFLARQEG